jgi:RHS repeat-associated protein
MSGGARPVAAVILCCLWAGLLAAWPQVATTAWAADGPPVMPEALVAPNGGVPIAGSTSNTAGYLPGSWDVSPAGAFTYTVPLRVPAGREGMAPELTLTYSSSGGDGSVGVGWSLAGAGSQIARCGKTPLKEGTRAGVRYGADDVFCLDGQKLVAVTGPYGGNQTEYRTERDSFAKIVSVTSGTIEDGPDQFVVYAKNGRTQTYKSVRAALMDESVGLTDEGVDEQTGTHTSSTHLEQHSSAVAAPKVGWELVRDEDRSGNAVVYEYAPTLSPHGHERVLSRIRYTSGPGRAPARNVDLVYEDRPDWSFGYVAGVRHAQTKRLTSVQMFAPNPGVTSLVYQYDLAYLPITGLRTRSQLDRVQFCGAEAKARRCLVAKKFTWANPALPAFTTTSVAPMPPQIGTPESVNEASRVGDFNGDGASDIVFNTGGAGDARDDRIRLSRRDATTGAVAPLVADHSLQSGDWPVLSGVPTPCWNGIHCPVPTVVRGARELDIDGDGGMEIVVTVTRAPDPDDEDGVPVHDTTRTEILRWDAAAHKFVDTGVEFPLGDASDWSDFADVNGDGRLDRFFSRRVPPAPGFSFDRSKVGVQLNTGTGFGPATFIDMYAHCAHRVADIDGDGRGELLLERPWEPVPGGMLNCGMGHGTDAVKVADDGTLTRVRGGEKHGQFVQGEGWSLPLLTPQFLGGLLGQVLYQNDLGAYRTFLGDFNGDGLRDVLVVRRALEWGQGYATFGGAFVLWNSGRGLYYDKDAPAPNIPMDDLADLQINDLNGDGRDDVVSFYNTGLQLNLSPSWKPLSFNSAPGAQDRISIGYSDGRGGFLTSTQITSAGRPAWNGAEFTRPFSRLGDVDADGRPDIIKNDGELKVMTQSGPVVDRIVAVSDEGSGLYRQEVTYSQAWTDHAERMTENSCALPSVCLRAGMTVVRKVNSLEHRFNGDLGPQPVYFSYDDPVAAATGGFAGFGAFRRWEPTRPLETITTYDVRTLKGGTVAGTGYRPFTGRPRTVTTVVPIKPGKETKQYPAATARVTQIVHDEPEFRLLNPLPGGKHASFAVFPTKTKVREYDVPATIDWNPDLTGRPATTHITASLTNATPFRQRTSVSTHDHFGNLTDTVTDTQGGPDAQSGVDPTRRGVRVSTHTDYDLSSARIGAWLTGIVSRTSVTHLEPDLSEVTRHVDHLADGLGRPWITITAKDTPDEVQASIGRDPATGVVTSTTVSTASLPVRVSRSDYKPLFDGQPDEQIYPSMVWDEHDKPQYRPVAWQLVQPAYGVTVATMDVNGVTTGTTIDGLGRPVTATSEQGPTARYGYTSRTDAQGNLDGMVTTVAVDTDLTGTGKRNVTGTTTDQVGRTRVVSTTGFDGTAVLTGTGYDRLGNVSWQTRPYRAGDPVRQTIHHTDTLGRPVSSTGPDGAPRSWEYPSPFTTRSTDPVGGVTTMTSDGDGRTIRRSTAGITTNIVTYAPFDLPRKTTDDRGNATVFSYDDLGRVRNVVDPDRGSVTTTYYGTGEVRTATHHGTGQESSFSYDDLGRLTTVVDKSPTGVSTTSRVWDTAAHGIGQLAQDTSPDGITTQYSYDSYGRGSGVTVKDTATGTGYSTGRTYDQLGRPDTFTYPATPGRPALRIRTGYNPYGFHVTTSDVTGAARLLLNITARNTDDALTGATLSPTGAITVARAYYPETGRLNRSTTTNTATGHRLQDLTYTYYLNGMVENRTQGDDFSAVRKEHFAYDDVNRLTDWDLTVGTNPTTETDYDFDTIGNLTDVTNSTGLTPDQHRAYPTDGVRPHAPSSDSNPTGNGIEKYHYDSAGRLEKVVDAAGKTFRTTTYTPFDLPRTITDKNGKATTFAYNADGVRIKESGPTGTTFTLPGVFEDRKDTAGRHTYVHHLPGIGQATYTDTQTTIHYALGDPLGSVTGTVSESGTLTGSFFYDPYGQRIRATGERLTTVASGPVNTGFGGLEHDDELRLINNNGRIYDPAAKLFQTPDPVLGNHPYGHTNNNPVNFTDPTGYDPEDHWGCSAAASCDDGQTYTPGVATAGGQTPQYGAPAGLAGCASDGACEAAPTPYTGATRSDDAGSRSNQPRGNSELVGGHNGPDPFTQAFRLGATLAARMVTGVVMGLFGGVLDDKDNGDYVSGWADGIGEYVDPLHQEKQVAAQAVEFVMAADAAVTPFLSAGGSSSLELSGAKSPFTGAYKKGDGAYAITHGVNPNCRKYNCSPASIAGIKRLAGTDRAAAVPGGGVTNVDEIAAMVRKEFGNGYETAFPSLRGVVRGLRERGAGSAAVITERLFGFPAARMAHTTVAFHGSDGVIRFYDFQNRMAGAYMPPSHVRFLNENGFNIMPEYHTVFVIPH